jgi:hypothetical protein
LAEAYDGVLVGPARLVRDLVDDGAIGHRSTIEAIGHLLQADLLCVRQAAEGAVLWVPGELMPDPDPSSRPQPRFAAAQHRNGRTPPTPTKA